MIIEKSSSELIDLKTRLYQIVAENKISSLDMMSDMVGTDEEMIRSALEELVNEGSLEGSFTPDGQRFFLSEITISTAPLAETQDSGYEIEVADTRNGKYVLISGLVMMIAGYIIRGFIALNLILDPIGSALVMIGLAVLLAGWLMISRAQPPSNIK